MGPSKAHIIRRELLFLEALLSQHKSICASQQRAINALPALPCLFQAALPELEGFDSCGFHSLLWTSPRKWYLQLKLHCPFLFLHIIKTAPLLANFFTSSLKYLNAWLCCYFVALPSEENPKCMAILINKHVSCSAFGDERTSVHNSENKTSIQKLICG